jgi:hypothetical protein
VSGLLRLYPRPWRERYGDEFEALLADRPPSVRHRLDIVRGALDAHFHPELVDPDRAVDRWWLAPVAGFGLLGLAVLIMLVSPERFDAYGSYREAPAAALPWVGAIALLILGVARLAWLIPAEPGALRVIESIGLSAGAIWMIAPWTGILGATFFAGIAVIAVGAWRSGVVSGWLASALVIAVSGPAALFVGTMILPWYALRQAGVGALVFVVCIVAIWPLVALCVRQARRVDRAAGDLATA